VIDRAWKVLARGLGTAKAGDEVGLGVDLESEVVEARAFDAGAGRRKCPGNEADVVMGVAVVEEATADLRPRSAVA